jgi:hypothetical protein
LGVGRPGRRYKCKKGAMDHESAGHHQGGQAKISP